MDDVPDLPQDTLRRMETEYYTYSCDIPNALDDEITDLVRRYIAQPASERQKIRNGLTPNQRGALRAFCNRMATLALRDKSEEHLYDGLSAAIMEDLHGEDYLDLTVPLSLIHYSASKISSDWKKLFQWGASLASPKMTEHLNGIRYVPALKGLELKVVKAKDGLRFAPLWET